MNRVSKPVAMDQGRTVLDDVTWQVERALSHRLAHDLNNSLGAIEVFAEMLAEDMTDPACRARLEKMGMASKMARSYVHALRCSIPKHGAGQGVSLTSQLFALVTEMLGEMGARFRPTFDPDLTLKGEISVTTYIFYHLVGHVLGCCAGDVTATVQAQEGDAVFTFIGQGTVNDLAWERPFCDDILAAHGATLAPLVQKDGLSGFSLHWPIAAL